MTSQTATTTIQVPKPHGWVGTTEAWAQGLGLSFAVLELALLVMAWRTVHRTGLTGALKQWLIVPLAIVPVMVVFLGYSHGIEASKSVSACGACHVMTPYVADLRDKTSDTLAAVHFKNSYIQQDHCYTCHSDYGMFGTLQAKWEGLGHVVRYTTRSYELPLKIARPYPTVRCLGCHGYSQKFLTSEGHPTADLPKLMSGEASCLECHGPAHPRSGEASP